MALPDMIPNGNAIERAVAQARRRWIRGVILSSVAFTFAVWAILMILKNQNESLALSRKTYNLQKQHATIEKKVGTVYDKAAKVSVNTGVLFDKAAKNSKKVDHVRHVLNHKK